jgi:hypothetical protein
MISGSSVRLVTVAYGSVPRRSMRLSRCNEYGRILRGVIFDAEHCRLKDTGSTSGDINAAADVFR